MNIILSFILILMGTIVLVLGMEMFHYEDRKKPLNKAVFVMFFCAFLWCGGYGWMSMCEDFSVAYVARTVGLIGVFGLVQTIPYFVGQVSGVHTKIEKPFLLVTFAAALTACVLLAQKSSAVFERTSYGTYYSSEINGARILEMVYIAVVMLYCFRLMFLWYNKMQFRRERLIIRYLILAGMSMAVGTIFDTLLPMFGYVSFPASCFGAFTGMLIVFAMSKKYNAFSINMKNVTDYLYANVQLPILILDENGYMEIVNDCAKTFFNLPPEKVRNDKLSHLFEISEEDCDRMIAQSIEENSNKNHRLIAKGNQAVCDVNITTVTDSYGEAFCTMCFVYDMTRESRMVEKLQKMTEQLEKKLEEKSREVESATLQTIAAVANTIDASDEYTNGHSVRVAGYCVAIAKELGWEESEIQNLKYMALLHDIGRVGVPDAIISKRGKLSEVEFNIIKEHTRIGGEILKEIRMVPQVEDGAKYHHERYDGQGYPFELKGEEIPLAVRIISIADAYDAMKSQRVYRDALKEDEIIVELKNGKGTQFDPNLVDVFVRLIENGLQIDKEVSSISSTDSLMEESSKLIQKIVDNQMAQTRKEAEKDYLTGLLNRRSAEKQIIKHLHDGHGCLMIIDLDNFKQVNDSMGHLSGDYVLQMVAGVLEEHHNNAISARIGGDEFVYYLKNVTEQEEVEPIIEGIMYTFNSRRESEPLLQSTSLSVGIALSSKVGRDYTGMFSKADKALYQVKKNGKSGYCFYSNDNMPDIETEPEKELGRIVHAIHSPENQKGSFQVEYREFTKIYDFVLNFAKRNNQKIQLLLLTLKNEDTRVIDAQEQEMAMKYLEEAILTSLRNVDISTRYSQTQFLVVLLNTDKQDIHIVSERIFQRFYRLYQGTGMVLDYNIAKLEE